MDELDVCHDVMEKYELGRCSWRFSTHKTGGWYWGSSGKRSFGIDSLVKQVFHSSAFWWSF